MSSDYERGSDEADLIWKGIVLNNPMVKAEWLAYHGENDDYSADDVDAFLIYLVGRLHHFTKIAPRVEGKPN